MNTNFTKSTIQPPCAFFCKSSKIVKAFYKICAVPNVSCSRKRGKVSNSCFFPKSLIDTQATDCVTLSPFKQQQQEDTRNLKFSIALQIFLTKDEIFT